MKDIKDNSLEFKPREKSKKIKAKVLKNMAITFTVAFEYHDPDHAPVVIQGHHDLTTGQLFSLPQGPMYLMAHLFKYMHDNMFFRIKEHLKTLYSNETLNLPPDDKNEGLAPPSVVPGPESVN